MRRIILVDIDGVLSDDRWREPRKMISWDEYHSAAGNDPPIETSINLINSMHEQGFYIVALTTRPEKWRIVTMRWLTTHNVAIDELIMRPENDYRKSPELKLALAEPFGEEVVAIIDNRQDVIEMFNENWQHEIVTMHVNPRIKHVQVSQVWPL